MHIKHWILGLVISLFIAGCGQKGGLYLPEPAASSTQQILLEDVA